jgi:hypothetical protein
VAEVSPQRLFVHAGVVGWQGRAILIPGRSHSGKSTLVAALVRAGATYYSDEYAVIDRQGRVHPYPKPLSLRDGPGGEASRHPVESLGGKVGSKPLPIALVLVSHYRAGASGRMQCLSPGRGLLALLANTVSARRQPALALGTLRQVASQALIIKVTRGEAGDTAVRFLTFLEKSHRHDAVAR